MFRACRRLAAPADSDVHNLFCDWELLWEELDDVFREISQCCCARSHVLLKSRAVSNETAHKRMGTKGHSA